MNDYFVPGALFESFFHRRFWMSQTVFDRLYIGTRPYYDYFISKKDVVGNNGSFGY